MTYTTQQLQAMSDDELFDALGEKFNSYIRRSALHEDIMPLAFERGISLIKDHDAEQYYACNAFDDRNYDFAYRQHEYFDDNPLRAIACLLLMMED